MGFCTQSIVLNEVILGQAMHTFFSPCSLWNRIDDSLTSNTSKLCGGFSSSTTGRHSRITLYTHQSLGFG
jgi:hypothetical protein